jgi:outer membrane protein
MMGRHIRAITGLPLLLGLLTAFGWAQDGKVGFINTQQILAGTSEGQQGMAALDEFMNQKRQEIEATGRELDSLQQDLSTKQRTLNPSALTELERSIQQKQRQLQRLQEDARADLTARQNNLIQAISVKVQQIVQEFAEENSYFAIFQRDQSQAYVSPSLDISEEIIRLYNERFPGPAGSTPAAPAN